MGGFEDLAPELLPHTPWFSMGADFADINNDGLMDFFATDMAGSTHYKSKMGMGDMEDKAWFLEAGAPRQYMRNALYLNSGAGPFMEIAHQAGIAASDWTWSPKFADFDCDGWVDLFISNGMTADLTNSDVIAGYSKPDSKPKEDSNMAFRNRGDLTFENVGEAWGLGIESVSFGAACGDLDNDGDADLIVNDWQAPCRVYRNDLSDAPRVKIQLRGNGSDTHAIGTEVRLTAGGMTQTRQLHLAHGFMSSDEPVLSFGLGDTESVEEVEITWPGGTKQTARNLAAGNHYVFSAPQKTGKGATAIASPTLFEAAPVNGRLSHRENEFDDFGEQPLLPNRLSLEGPPLAVGDLDGDGSPDLILGGAAGQACVVWLNQKEGFRSSSRQVFEEDSSSEDIAMELFDVEGDGDLDLYLVSGGYEFYVNSRDLADRLYLNDGKGNFSKAVNALPKARDSGGCVASSDFDGDGDLDLFVGGRMVPGSYPEIPRSRLLRNDSSAAGVRFTEVEASGLSEIGMVTAAIWADIDNDKDPDLLVALDWGPVKLFRNSQGTFEDADAGMEKHSGWWRSLTATDVDSDGDLDLVAGNFGLNSKYHPQPGAPVSIYFGDFEGDGKFQIVEAAVKGGLLLPIRGKSCSQDAIPSLRRKFPTYHQFAISSLEDIYSEQTLGDSLKLEVNELRSGIFLNNGKGNFNFSPLPPLAQIAPSSGIAVLDANGDGHGDLFLAQNFYGPQRESGRMDGGLSVLLMGDGKGKFEQMWPDKSGIVIPGDARSVAVEDLNGDNAPDLIIVENNGPVRVFHNRGKR